MALQLLKKGKVIFIITIGLLLLFLIVLGNIFRNKEFKPSDFSRFQMIDVSVINKKENRVLIFTNPEEFGILQKFFLELSDDSAQYNRNNTDGYFMKIYFKNHEPVGVNFYKNQDYGNVIVLGDKAYYNDNFWTFLDSLYNF